ncbi:dynein heavy chain 2 [Salpingoeca rosetta]|uniref:Dynein axonemal heavy chain 2 n=1 Tax=Salpingoeca rosetta (strain ATCC 50818 / BSB-021) TaxID=946362 RepID=F2U1V3_SALR5|nr:dynein heavy chain 2 [Salpingoeca rosetta]EGD81605.1 dynein heavy chain 2 [Salpingoeca rosetta]|eukprot:XP_004996809.1 dynein heavy chain 2 [Salpingoeca rosetta]
MSENTTATAQEPSAQAEANASATPPPDTTDNQQAQQEQAQQEPQSQESKDKAPAARADGGTANAMSKSSSIKASKRASAVQSKAGTRKASAINTRASSAVGDRGGNEDEEYEEYEDDEEELADEEESDGEEIEVLVDPQPDPDPIPAPPPKPANLRDFMVNEIKSRVHLEGTTESEWNNDMSFQAIFNFFTRRSSVLLTVYQSEGMLVVSHSPPAYPVGRLIYFVRAKPELIYPDSQFDDIVHTGVLQQDYLDSLVRLMNDLFSPLMSHAAKQWPDSVRNEFAAGMNRFMSSLTDVASKSDHNTVLYVPNEDLSRPMEVMLADRDLVQRLETTVIRWTRQVKDVLNTTHAEQGADIELPTDEIDFWQRRFQDMSGISEQLDKEGVATILKILEAAGSSYLNQFQSWSQRIKDGMEVSKANFKFLGVLRDPCTRLYTSNLNAIAEKLPTIIDLIRLIELHSQHYTSREQITSLFQKVSNAIIMRCRECISLDEIFEGDVDDSVRIVTDAISCCEAWKSIYEKRKAAHLPHSSKPWVVSHSSVFAQIDAFIQRCKDLLIVCSGQKHFARKKGVDKVPLPHFAGTRGLEVARALSGVEARFEESLTLLRKHEAHILDVKSSKYQGYFNTFKESVKELEVMVQNAVTTAFQHVTTVENGVELIETFGPLGQRDIVKRALDKCTAHVFKMFADQLEDVKAYFNNYRQAPPLEPGMPPYAGASMWATGLLNQITHVHGALANAKYVQPGAFGDEVLHQYTLLAGALRDFVSKAHSTWVGEIKTDLAALLNNPLLKRDGTRTLLLLNFDKDLLVLFAEVKHWLKLGLDIPSTAMEMFHKNEELRALRCFIMLVVRDYNQIIEKLSVEEQALFRERIRFLDSKVQHGLTKLTWASKGIKDYYVADCRMHAKQLKEHVDKYMLTNQRIARLCAYAEKQTMVSISLKRVYTVTEFHEAQQEQIAAVRKRFLDVHREIVRNLQKTYEVFKKDGHDVQQHWRRYVQKVDRMLEESLRTNVKRSLNEFVRAIVGDGKSIPSPVFRVNVALEDRNIVLQPTYGHLCDVALSLHKEMVDALLGLDRLTTILCKGIPANAQLHSRTTRTQASLAATSSHGSGAGNRSNNALRKGAAKTGTTSSLAAASTATVSTTAAAARDGLSFFECSRDDADVLKMRRYLEQGLKDNEPNLRDYVGVWHESYHEIWQTDIERFLQRYAQMNPPLAQFDGDIARYAEVANNVQKEETFTPINFVQLDCTMLKYSLLELCNQWQEQLTELLHRRAKGDLARVREYLQTQSELLSRVPEGLSEVISAVENLNAAKAQAPRVEAKFGPLQEEFEILEKYEVELSDEVSAQLDSLPAQWNKFKLALDQADDILADAKAKCKTDLLADMDDLSRSVTEVRATFVTTGPFAATITPDEALQAIEEFRHKLENIRSSEESLKAGLKVFGISHEPFKEVADTHRDLDQLTQLWTLAKEWDDRYNEWKQTQFADVDTDAMEQQAVQYNKKFVKLAREVKDKDWDMVQTYRRRVEQFKRTMPLIQDLKNPALRQRHWHELQEHVGSTFDHTSAEFTLGTMIDLGFDRFVEEVNAISGAASKELSIEQGIDEIAEVWGSTSLEIGAYKDRGHYTLKGTDEIYQLLEDHQVTLSTMKASRFVKAFESDVDFWERTLSMVLEVIEVLLTVQRQWMYLENIFTGEDIRRQLPIETNKFDAIDDQFLKIGQRLHEDPNAQRGTHAKGLLQQLNDMNLVLEQIQKSLDEYLETKRQYFPRFYFVSNDDLLEILGQSKNPKAVQPHLLKCFDSIKALELNTPPGRKVTQALGMHSPDGEYVPFKVPVALDGPVESWLLKVEGEMRHSLKALLQDSIVAHKKQKRDKWLREWAGQLVLTVSQLAWTSQCVAAMSDAKGGPKKGLKVLKKKWVSLLNKLTEAVRSVKNKTQRKKLVALITIEVHSRDVIDRLTKVPNINHNAFEWLMQLRFYWEHGSDAATVGECVIRQTNTRFTYGYEYLGNSGRLVITPLTDRCYMTLTTALHLKRGGSPKGPAGTGKTETCKDLGKALGDYVIIVNVSSDGMDYKSLGGMFSGLAQTGAWGCFDEFNRINIEVLSVVAQQILSILQAQIPLSPDNPQRRFIFEGTEINLRWSCGVFITMNPGYAGRTELPDNLKSMFRPISMMKPDTGLIAEIILFGQGFSNTRVLAKKADTLYKLAVQQLSKQDHYDFGLRALVSTLLYAGRKRQAMPDIAHEEVLLMAMKDMNVAKMTNTDLPLLQGMMADLFPGVETHEEDYGKFKEAIVQDLKANGYQTTDWMVTKVIQLYETKNSRHAVMIVGHTGSGKSVAWRTLQRAMSQCKKDNVPGFEVVRDYPLNPKALSLAELYGEFNIATNEWADGVLSSVMRTTCSDDRSDQKWIVFDGPVDTLWIESMNSVMDDNKILTLINGERISMPSQVSLLFEVEDLAVASPATVSRCGMVYHDTRDLGWQPFVASWLDAFPDKGLVPVLRDLFDKFVDKMLTFVDAQCVELVPTSQLNRVKSLCCLLSALLTPGNGVQPTDAGAGGVGTKAMEQSQERERIVGQWFLFSLVWSVCAGVNEQGRKLVDNYLRELEGQFPSRDTVYEYFVDVKNGSWAHWDTELRSNWRYSPDTPFHRIHVPTVDTVRYQYLVRTLIDAKQPTLMVGPVGTGKTSVVEMVMRKLDPATFNLLTINMSSKTSSNNVQEIIEGQVEKRTKGVFVPLGGKQLLTFLDDLNMPAKDTFGSQPPLELLRQWMEYGFVYDREKQVIKHIRDMRIVAAMGPPGGGRSIISRRLQARFNLLNMTFPTDSQIKRIFGTMINLKLQDFDEGCKPVGNMVTEATIHVYNYMSTRMLPTPTKIHYLFNLRDISKVFQGMLRAHKDFHDTKDAITRLWVHECFRVFCDRLVTERDQVEFTKLVEEKLHEVFDVSLSTLCPGREVPVFADFMREGQDPVYEDVREHDKLKTVLEEKLEDYNASGHVPMDLVLFRDAVQHVARIVRVIRMQRGNMMLIGVGGSGRQSLTRLAAFVLEHKTFQIEVTRQYRMTEFREDLKALYRQAGVENKPTTFLFVDTQIVLEDFLEDINNILSSGEVPNLFPAEEMEEVFSDLRPEAKKAAVEDTPSSLTKFFIERVRNNLHVVLCMSPVGEAFRNRLRMYPGLVNCTTIDYFSAWPQDALLAVADRFMSDVDLTKGMSAAVLGGNAGGGDGDDAADSVGGGLPGHGSDAGDAKDDDASLKKGSHWAERLRSAVLSTFAVIQQSVLTASQQMLDEVKRHNYVTPTNYLELVTGYRLLLAEKRKELGDAADKLINGLDKIDETREKVEVMSVELEETKKQVAQFQRECDDYLVIIVQQKRDADDQQKAVSARSEKIGIEAQECEKLAADAEADLKEALPALQAAMDALKSLNKNDISEIKAYTKPPDLVAMVMEAVMVLRKSKPEWSEAKRQLADPNFIKQLVEFDKDNMSDKVLRKIHSYVTRPEFDPDQVGRVSNAAKSLCMWVRAMDVYGRIFKVVEPKRLALKKTQDALAAKQKSLADAQRKLKEVTEKVEELQRNYEAKLKQQQELAEKSRVTALKLDRAAKLVTGLAGERSRWEQSVAELRVSMGYLVGDCLLAAGFLSYLGPFTSTYRDSVVQRWLRHVRSCEIPCDPNFDMARFLAKPTDVRFWNIQGLPSDRFSTENGVIVTRGRRWPLMIDPQGQAIKWIKNMEREHGLKVVDLQMPDYIRTLENAIQFGTPVLMQNVGEELDPSLGPILNKAFTKVGGRLMLRLGDKEIEYNPDFRFYITTKMANPHYTPETSTKTTIVNFAVVEEGLEAQLLGIVVSKERPELEEQKNELVTKIASGKKKLVELEDRILHLLSTAKGSLLDDEELVNTLNSSKVTSVEVGEQLVVAERTEAEIDEAREGYRACAERASILFFVMNDIASIDPMYQFSLAAYINLFVKSIDSSSKAAGLEQRIESINDYHTYAVYRYTCRGLFEKHKLLFAFHMNSKILERANKIQMNEYNFFLRGGQVLDRDAQMPNPAPSWISSEAWDNITEMERLLPKFTGLAASFEQMLRDWHTWYVSPEPEAATLPGEWENACNELQRMAIVRSLRPDRVSVVATNFIVNNLGQRFVEPPPLDMRAVLSDSRPQTPLIFVLSVGVDPTKQLMDLADRCNMTERFHTLSLGQGQAPIAERLLREGTKHGHWVFLANCHLSLSWMPSLSKIVEMLEVNKPHPDFRLWLSSKPNPQFPISILQAGIKMTTEPPKGIKANMKRLYTTLTEDQFERVGAVTKYKKLMFCLTFFHSVLLERRKFQMLGWNVQYPFNDSDYEVSENLLGLFLDEYQETPWDALKYLIAGINYGGHVTDDWDRRLLLTYINELFCEDALNVEHFRVSSSDLFYVPTDGSLQSYKDYVASLPNSDPPSAFGQNANADISSMIREARTLLDTLVALQPAVTTEKGGSREDVVLELAQDMLERLPEKIDYDATAKLLAVEPNPLNVVLLQEIARYNALLSLMERHLIALRKGIQGLVVMSSDLEEILTFIFNGQVPPVWKKTYPSQKPLAGWMRDLIQRVDFFRQWAVTGRQPLIYWMSAFTFPTGFLTAVLQNAARNNAVSVDTLSWEFPVMTLDDVNIVEQPKDGVYIKGLFLEGAGWDKKRACLEEAAPMQLVCSMPTIHFKPVEKKATKKNVYACPCYYYPNRAGEGGASAWSFVIAVDLKSGDRSAEHWIKRGTALLMSLEN